MNWTLKQHFHIESARRLPKLSEGHPCARIHGHSFKIVLSLRGDLDPQAGWVIDYNDIISAFDPLHKQLDHAYLNEVPGLENPTSELLAKWIFDRLKPRLPSLETVSIMETPTTECIFPG
jgi:6-pyruvoyltetrahydropterin/6-carboxytetrahydropterin synthase